ncbi:hypothetical protein NBRC116601_26430 [Cognatishimia sp. WU-CL00825]|uniref:hypothetical protein n=1 Tax=Cognatishimia sp. WU-CL00825 TaxID=3127658 RepID=UPI0031086339
MRRLGITSMGGAMIALATSLSLTAPAAAHTADQYLDTMLEIAGVDIVSQSRSGHDLDQRLDLPSEMPIWRYLYHGTPEFALRDVTVFGPAWVPPVDAVVVRPN